MEDACSTKASERDPVPIFAVLGNHDYKERESPLLQRKRIPEYLANWRMPEGLCELHELPGGVSLILLQSMDLIHEEQPRDFVRALRRSRGPWRIVAAHHPMADPGRGYDRDYAEMVESSIRKADVPVQLFLAGHEHNMQVLVMDPPMPGLHVVVGSGSSARKVRSSQMRRPYAAESLGFARVDLVRSGGAERLVSTLYEVPTTWPLAVGTAQLGARFAVDLEGRVERMERLEPAP